MSPRVVREAVDRISPRSPGRSSSSSSSSSSPQVPRNLAPSPVSSPGIEVTTADGKRIRLSRRVLDDATIATATSPGSKYKKILVFDSGFGGLDMCVELAKLGLCALIHIKGAHALFPKEALDDALRGHPGGSHLEMETTIKGIKFIAIGYKYNSKKTLFFLAPEGAGGTGDGEFYVTKWPDSDGNILTRNVVRLVLASRYFLCFNKVDKHNQLRQSELALEKKWITTDGWFRLFTTLVGINVVDTMLVLRSESHSTHPYKTISTRAFTEILAEDLIMNQFDGKLSRPKPRAAARLAVEAPPGGVQHTLKQFGYKSAFGLLQEGKRDRLHQKRCIICKKKTTYYCTAAACRECAVCRATGSRSGDHTERDCYVEHLKRSGVSLESQTEFAVFSPAPAKRPCQRSAVARV